MQAVSTFLAWELMPTATYKFHISESWNHFGLASLSHHGVLRCVFDCAKLSVMVYFAHVVSCCVMLQACDTSSRHLLWQAVRASSAAPYYLEVGRAVTWGLWGLGCNVLGLQCVGFRQHASFRKCKQASHTLCSIVLRQPGCPWQWCLIHPQVAWSLPLATFACWHDMLTEDAT